MSDSEKTPEETTPAVDPKDSISTKAALSVLWDKARTPIIVGVSALAGAIIYAKATAEPSDDQDDVFDVLEITEVDPTE